MTQRPAAGEERRPRAPGGPRDGLRRPCVAGGPFSSSGCPGPDSELELGASLTYRWWCEPTGREGAMDVVVQYFDGCPHAELAMERVRQALQSAGLADQKVLLQRVDSPEEAAG